MRLALGLALVVLTVPAAAQIETQQLEPLLLPSEGGSITVDPIERRAPDEADPFREGFNDEAFRNEPQPRRRDPFRNEDSFIDRAFSDSARDDQGEYRQVPGLGGRLEVSPLPSAEGEIDVERSLTTRSEILRNGAVPRFEAAPRVNRLFGRGQRLLLPQTETVASDAVELRTLDKMTGATDELVVRAGEERVVGRLKLLVEGCRQAADGGKHGTTAFLRIWDPERHGTDPVFQGWMFAESPALSALDHPRYDVWVVSCDPQHAAKVDGAEEG